MGQLILGIVILMISTVGAFYGQQLAREGWSAWRDSKRPAQSPSVVVKGNIGNTQTVVASNDAKQSIDTQPTLPPLKGSSSMQSKELAATPSAEGVVVGNNGGNTQVAVNSPGAQQTIHVHGPIQRNLSSYQRQKLVSVLRPFAGSKIDVAAPLGDSESERFALGFISVFREAGVDCGANDGLDRHVWSPAPQGIEVTVNESEARAGRGPAVLQPLVGALKDLGLLPKIQVFVRPEISPGTVEFRVGSP